MLCFTIGKISNSHAQQINPVMSIKLLDFFWLNGSIRSRFKRQTKDPDSLQSGNKNIVLRTEK